MLVASYRFFRSPFLLVGSTLLRSHATSFRHHHSSLPHRYPRPRPLWFPRHLLQIPPFLTRMRTFQCRWYLHVRTTFCFGPIWTFAFSNDGVASPTCGPRRPTTTVFSNTANSLPSSALLAIDTMSGPTRSTFFVLARALRAEIFFFARISCPLHKGASF